MRFLLHLSKPDGSRNTAIYDTETSYFEIDSKATEPAEIRNWKSAIHVSAAVPGRKTGNFKVLKISMGLGCNMSCSYCQQKPHEDDASTLADAKDFLAKLDTWWTAAPDDDLRIEFWGGEPLVYWAKLKLLVDAFRRRHPRATLRMFTNGTLLDQVKAQWIVDNKISVSISHDGPGQMDARGQDPFKIPEALMAIKWLVANHSEKPVFNCVLTNTNYSLGTIRAHIAAALGSDAFDITTEGLVQVESVDSALRSPMTEADHDRIRLSLLSEMVSGEATLNGTVARKCRDFLTSLALRRPLRSVEQKCGLEQEDHIVVDLKGNVLTCQNTPEEEMRVGQVGDLDGVRFDKGTHFMHRPECLSCPVVQLCKGACMFVEGQNRKMTCWNNFTFNAAILSGAIYQLTGWLVTDIEPVADVPERATI